MLFITIIGNRRYTNSIHFCFFKNYYIFPEISVKGAIGVGDVHLYNAMYVILKIRMSVMYSTIIAWREKLL